MRTENRGQRTGDRGQRTEDREQRTENSKIKARPTGKQKGLSSMEYVVIVTAILLALLAMQVSLRRAISSRWRDAADSTFGTGRQYEPGVTQIR